MEGGREGGRERARDPVPSFVALVIGAYFGGPTGFAPSRPWQEGHSPRIFRSRMEPLELAILAGGAFAAGVINTQHVQMKLNALAPEPRATDEFSEELPAEVDTDS